MNTKGNTIHIMMDKDHGGILESKKGYNWLPDFVYAGIDGSVTTFAIVAGVEGASLSIRIILILGLANILADGFSMSVGKYSSEKTHQELYDRISKIEYKHLKEKTTHEKKEVEEIVKSYGFTGEDKKRATEIITSNPDKWVELMMRHEFNMIRENADPIRGAVTTFISFILIGFIPLVVYVFQPFLRLEQRHLFFATCIATLVALFLVGSIKSHFSTKRWFRSGVETVAIGGVAATIAYGVGFFLRGLTVL